METVTLFGYGSIVAAESARKTLQRELPDDAMSVARLRGYIRVWNYVDFVQFEDDPPGTSTPVVFLNVEKDPDAFCNGVLLQVSQEELVRFDQRERLYDRVEITDCVDPAAASSPSYVYAATGSATVIPPNAVIPQRYEELVIAAAMSRGKGFADEFFAFTRDSQLPRRPGLYRFTDPEQMAAAGQSSS